jgi:hypothetical protein
MIGQHIARHIRSNLVAYLALFLALGGSSVAATTALLPTNSVGSRQVIDHSLLRQDFKLGQLLRGPRGPRGAQGPTGPKGEAGPSMTLVVTTAEGIAGGLNGTNVSAFARCPAGTTVVGGGFSKLQNPGVSLFVDVSQPDESQNGWAVVVHGESNGMPAAVPQIHAYARCARLAPP